MDCRILAIFLLNGIVNGIFGDRIQGPISFRTSTSTLLYTFPTTETTTQAVIYLVFSTSKCSGKILDIPSRDTHQHYYSLKLQSSGKLYFEYNLLDGKFTLELKANSSRIVSFCDGRKHAVYLRRLNRDVYYRVDSGNLYKHVEHEITQKPSLSKPDGVFIGGDTKEKFIGCIYNVSVTIHWSKLPKTTIDLVQMYLDGHHRISGRDLFIDACVERNAECRPTKTQLLLTKPSGVIASPVQDNITACTWIIAAPSHHRVKLRLLLLRVNNSFACVDNHVEIVEGKSAGSQLIGRYCNPKLTMFRPLYSIGRYLTVVLTIDSSEAFDFVAKYTIVNLSEGPCPVRAELRGQTGVFSTPHFPYNHGNSRHCTWIIDVPHGKHVLITFKRKDFHVEGCSVDCECDFLEVFTERGGLKSFYGRYCGFLRPSPIVLTGEKALIKFASDSKESRRGFKAKYTITDSVESQCFSYTLLTNLTGIITSPRFPLPYPGQMDCLWAIQGPPNTRVKLIFMTPLYLDLNCTDFIDVTDGVKKGTQTFMKKLCITVDVPQPIISGGRDLFFRFVSDKYQQLNRKKTGFKVKYEVSHDSSSKGASLVGNITSLVGNISVLSITAYALFSWMDIVGP